MANTINISRISPKEKITHWECDDGSVKGAGNPDLGDLQLSTSRLFFLSSLICKMRQSRYLGLCSSTCSTKYYIYSHVYTESSIIQRRGIFPVAVIRISWLPSLGNSPVPPTQHCRGSQQSCLASHLPFHHVSSGTAQLIT